MEKTVTIDGKEVRFRASAAIPRLYRLKFERDILVDMKSIAEQLKGQEEATFSTLPLETLSMFEDVAYLMARHADPQGVPADVDEWLDTFDTFSIYQVFPVIMDLWGANLQQMNVPQKNKAH